MVFTQEQEQEQEQEQDGNFTRRAGTMGDCMFCSQRPAIQVLPLSIPVLLRFLPHLQSHHVISSSCRYLGDASRAVPARGADAAAQLA
jgi:hypothetical protein